MHFCSLSSGSNGNSHFIRSKDASILVDCGLSLRYTEAQLFQIGETADSIDAVFVTHEHSDHIAGLGAFHRRSGCDIFLTKGTLDAAQEKLGKINSDKVHLLSPGIYQSYKDIDVLPIPVSHDAAMPVAYVFESRGKKLSVLTDLGEVNPSILAAVANSGVLLIESNHDLDMLNAGPYPYHLKKRVASSEGHLSNAACADALLKLLEVGKLGQVLLGHLSSENNLPSLAFQTVSTHLEKNGIELGIDLNLDLCYRRQISSLLRL